MSGYKAVDIRHRGHNAPLYRSVAGLATVGVGPDHRAREPTQTLHLLTEERRIAAFPAVAGNDHDGAARHAALPPTVDERLQDFAQSRAAGPVRHHRAHGPEGIFGVGVLHG